MMQKMRERKSLMVEELFENAKSNGQIYINDQLTPYYSNLLACARKAKAGNRIYALTSRNGRIGIKKTSESRFAYVTNEKELLDILDSSPFPNNGNGESNKLPANDKMGLAAMQIGPKRKLSEPDSNNNNNTSVKTKQRKTRLVASNPTK